jgi:GT2 family glycosyltransferase
VKTAALVITYRSEGHIARCLESLQRWGDCLSEGVLVIDNASDDGTCEEVKRFPFARLVVNGSNLGFAGAVNEGFRLLPSAEAVLLLNPDAEVTGGLPDLLEPREERHHRLMAGLLTDSGGTPQAGFAVRRFPDASSLVWENLGLNRLWRSNPVNRRYRALDLDLTQEQDVEQPAGAFLLVPRKAWEETGGFDERFWPAWFEDVDFTRRARQAGWPARLAPSATAVHAGGHSFAKVSWSQRQHDWYGNLLRYAAIHLDPAGRRMVAASVVVGLAPRAVTGMFRGRSLRPLRVYFQLFGIAAGLFFSTGRAPSRETSLAVMAGGRVRPDGS